MKIKASQSFCRKSDVFGTADPELRGDGAASIQRSSTAFHSRSRCSAMSELADVLKYLGA
jgi:hypothetical protein